MEEMTLEIDITGKTGLRDKTQGRTKQTQAARQQTRLTEGGRPMDTQTYCTLRNREGQGLGF